MLTLTQIQQILEQENLLREFITPTRWTLTAPFDKSFQKFLMTHVKSMRIPFFSVKETISNNAF